MIPKIYLRIKRKGNYKERKFQGKTRNLSKRSEKKQNKTKEKKINMLLD